MAALDLTAKLNDILRGWGSPRQREKVQVAARAKRVGLVGASVATSLLDTNSAHASMQSD